MQTLEAAHDRGIVHRDVKTTNVFVTREGDVRLLDFGFAKLLRAPSITGADTVAGSPSYLAPELWLKGSSYADPLVDVYALGVVLFRVLGGRLPFEGTVRLRSLEGGTVVETDTDATRDRYLEAMRHLQDAWERTLVARGGRLVRAETSEDPVRVVRSVALAVR